MTALAVYAVYPIQGRDAHLRERMNRGAADAFAATVSLADPRRSYYVMDTFRAVAEYRAGVLRACELHAPLSMDGHMLDRLPSALLHAASALVKFQSASSALRTRGEYIASTADGRACCLAADRAKSLMHTAFRQLLAGEG